MSTTPTTISVSLLNASTAKAQLVTLPRDMTVAELQRLAPKGASFTVDGCTPSGATTLGDLRDACTACKVLEVRFLQPMRFGGQCYSPCLCVSTDGASGGGGDSSSSSVPSAGGSTGASDLLSGGSGAGDLTGALQSGSGGGSNAGGSSNLGGLAGISGLTS